MKAVAAQISEKNASPKKVESAKQAQTNEPAIAPEFSGSIPMLQKKSICPCDGGCPNCSGEIQTKLTIGQPNDKYEQEADQVADQVMRMPETKGSLGKREKESSLVNGHLSLGRKEKESPLVQRQTEEEEEEEEPIQTKPMRDGITPLLQRQTDEEEEEEEPVQTKLAGPQAISTGLQQKINTTRGGGQPLSGDSRAFFEARFGRDFSNVNVHTGSQAAQINKDLNAQAFTSGNDIYFNQGKYAPHTDAGRHLLAHELTHVIQQRHGEIRRKSDNFPYAPGGNGAAATNKSNGKGTEKNKPANQQQDREISFEPTPKVEPQKDDNVKDKAEKKKKEETKDQGTDKDKKKSEVEGKEKDIKVEPGLPEKSTAKKTGKAGDGDEGGEIKAVEVMAMEGPSEQVMDSFTKASASQIAVSFPVLGPALEKKLNDEQKEAAENVPLLIADTSGTKKLGPGQKPGETKKKTADIKDGVSEPEPPKQKAEPHQHLAPPPENKKNSDILDKQDLASFLSWFRGKFKNFMSTISTTDPGVNVSAGERPTIDTSVKADPNRVENQRQEGETQVQAEKDDISKQIRDNPGQKNIQPLRVKEENKPAVSKESGTTVATPEQDDMAKYGALPLPVEVRDKADEKMAPLLEKSMAKPRQEAAAAAATRDEEKKKAEAEAVEKTAKLNTGAQNEQNRIVLSYRKIVADEQAAGLEEAQQKLNDFNAEADKEQGDVKTTVDERIKADEGEAAKILDKAEEEAELEKIKGEEKARNKKKELEEESKNDSWWDRAADVIMSAVELITEAIDEIIDAARKLVLDIIDKAEEAALTIIEAGRTWVIEKLDKYGTWLKNKVNTYLKDYPKLAEKINDRIDSTVDTAKEAVNKAADTLKERVEAIADKLAEAIDWVLDKFQTALKAAVQIAGAVITGDFAEAARIAFLAVIDIAGVDPKPIMDFVNKAGETINIIFDDPVAFFRNVANGVKGGVKRFEKEAPKHLENGLLGWLTGALSDVQITMPETLDAKGIFSLGMQILGLTYQNIRAKLVKKLKPKGEQIVSSMESKVQFVKDLKDFIGQGAVVLWKKVKESLTNLKKTVLEGIQKWVTISIIKEGIFWLLSMLNPASAIVKVLKLLYDFVMFLRERWGQIVDFAKSVFDSVGVLARGNLEKAAKAVEDAMGRSVPVIISLLASLAGLSGISKTIKEIIERVRAPIDKALDKVIDWLVKKGKALFAKGKAAVKKGKEALKSFFKWWKVEKKFKLKNKESHRMFFEGKGKSAKTMIRSDKKPLRTYFNEINSSYQKLPEDDPRRSGDLDNNLNAIDSKLAALEKKKTEGDKPQTPVYFQWSHKFGKEIADLMRDIALLMEKVPGDLGNPALAEEGAKARPVSSTIIYTKTKTTSPVIDPFVLARTGRKKDDNYAQLKKSSEDGQIATIETLSFDLGENVGSRGESKSPLMKALKKVRGRQVKPGHLINHNVGGPGNVVGNIAPITESANAKMTHGAEKKVKNMVIQQNKVVRYMVKIKWPETSRPDGWSELDKRMPESIHITLQEKEFKHENFTHLKGDEYIKAKKNPENWKPKKKLSIDPIPVEPFTKKPEVAGISETKKKILEVLEKAAKTRKEIRTETGIKKNTLNPRLREMEKENLIERAGKKDGVLLFKATNAGAAALL